MAPSGVVSRLLHMDLEFSQSRGMVVPHELFIFYFLLCESFSFVCGRGEPGEDADGGAAEQTGGEPLVRAGGELLAAQLQSLLRPPAEVGLPVGQVGVPALRGSIISVLAGLDVMEGYLYSGDAIRGSLTTRAARLCARLPAHRPGPPGGARPPAPAGRGGGAVWGGGAGCGTQVPSGQLQLGQGDRHPQVGGGGRHCRGGGVAWHPGRTGRHTAHTC